MYIIDTNILIWVLRGNKEYIDIFHKLKYKGMLFISTITIAEIYKNTFPSEITKTEHLLEKFEILEVTAKIAKQGGFYWQELIKRFKKINILDCLIAATAKEHGLTLITLNTRHFPMKDIKVMDPLK